MLALSTSKVVKCTALIVIATHNNKSKEKLKFGQIAVVSFSLVLNLIQTVNSCKLHGAVQCPSFLRTKTNLISLSMLYLHVTKGNNNHHYQP